MRKYFLLTALIPFFFNSFAQNSNIGGTEIKSNVLTIAREKLGEQKFLWIVKTIYLSAIKGVNGKPPVTVYQNELLTKVITPNEILKKGGTEETIQIPRYKNDPESQMIDTVIKNEFRPDDVKGCRLVQNITKSDDIMKYSAEMVAISLTYDLIVAGVHIEEPNLFYVKFADLKTILEDKMYSALVNACIP